MPKIHNVVLGDKITNISIKYYGTASKTGLIISGNPQLKGRPISLESLPTVYPGDIIIIPDETINPVNIPELKTAPDTIQVKERDSITIIIDGVQFSFFSDYELTQELDSFDSITFSAPNDTENPINKIKFRPFEYKPIAVYYDGILQFAGTLMSVISESNPDSKIISFSAYPKCGVVNDCNVPISIYPVEFENQNLEQIANKLLSPFGIQAVFLESFGNNFKKVAIEPEQKIYDFLSDLANQRGLIITNSPQGNLLFWKANTSGASNIIIEGEIPFISCSPDFNTQEYYSHITGFLPTKKSNNNSQVYTWENPFLKKYGILRPYSFVIEDSESGDLRKAVEEKAGRMFGNSCSYTLTVQGHRNKNGDLYQKNTIINLYSPNSMIFKPTNFIIKSLTLSRSADSGDVTVMNLVLPESYTGSIPKVVPWEA